MVASIPISSAQNPTYKRSKALLNQARQRHKLGQSVLEGVHLLEAAYQAHWPIQEMLLTQTALQSPEVAPVLTKLVQQQPQLLVYQLSNGLYQNLRSLGTGVDVMAIIDCPLPTLPKTIDEDCLILNDVQDSGNVGTLLRTAAAMGLRWVLSTKGSAQAWSPKTLRAGMGAQFTLTIIENMTGQQLLRCVRTPMVATSSHADTLIYQTDLRQPVAWVLGNEGQGVDAELLSVAQAVALPQPNGQESLNVAIAGSLCLYETLRQRRYATITPGQSTI